MDGALSVVAIIGGVITVFGVLAALVAYVRGSYNKALIEALRKNVAQYLERIEYLERAEIRHKEKESKWAEERQHMLAENATLLMAATKAADVEALKNELNEHHLQAMAAWTHIGRVLERMAGDDDAE